MDIQSAIRTVTEHRDLSGDEMTSVMRAIMSGETTQSQIGGFLIGLRMKGETVEEIAAAATVMRELATPVHVEVEHLVDTCGTGGDGSNTFNISTASAFVAAGAGARVAKHGNRSASSSSGSADVLEAAGVNLDLSPEQVAQCIREVGVGFMFAPKHHGAMKHAIGPRKDHREGILMNRRTNRTAFLIPEDTPGSFGVLVSGVLKLTGVDRWTAQGWAVARGYRVRVLRTVQT